jgi:hypothetical protein
MRIPKHLIQFREEPTLLLVTGKQDAVIYKAFRGTLEKLTSFKIPRPHYSDNEGTASTPHELRDRDIIRDFLHELNARLKSIGTVGYKALYLFTPSNVKNKIQNGLPQPLQAILKGVIEGNYYNFSPSQILAKIV